MRRMISFAAPYDGKVCDVIKRDTASARPRRPLIISLVFLMRRGPSLNALAMILRN